MKLQYVWCVFTVRKARKAFVLDFLNNSWNTEKTWAGWEAEVCWVILAHPRHVDQGMMRDLSSEEVECGQADFSIILQEDEVSSLPLIPYSLICR